MLYPGWVGIWRMASAKGVGVKAEVFGIESSVK